MKKMREKAVKLNGIYKLYICLSVPTQFNAQLQCTVLCAVYIVRVKWRQNVLDEKDSW